MLVKGTTGSECVEFRCIFSRCVHRDSNYELLVGELAVVTVFMLLLCFRRGT